MLGNTRLDEKWRGSRVNPGGEPVYDHLPDVIFNNLRVFIVGRECMPVSDEKITLIFVLQLDPVLENTVIVTEMQPTGGAHATQHTFLCFDLTHGDTGPIRCEGISKSFADCADQVLIFKAIRRKTLEPLYP